MFVGHLAAGQPRNGEYTRREQRDASEDAKRARRRGMSHRLILLENGPCPRFVPADEAAPTRLRPRPRRSGRRFLQGTLQAPAVSRRASGKLRAAIAHQGSGG